MSVVEQVATRRQGRAAFKVNARSNSTGAAVIDAAGSPILFDASLQSAQEGLPGPAELLAAAFASCLLKNLDCSRTALGFRYDEAEVDVMVERQERPARFVAVTYTLRVTTDEPEQRVDRMHDYLLDNGAVYNTLASVCEVHGNLEVHPRG